jgi:kynurenine formamidase
VTKERRVEVSAEEFTALFEAVSNWGRWGEDDERGTLNELSADRIVAAANLVRSGETVTLSHPWDTERRIDNPEPAVHRMTLLPDVDVGSGTLRFTKDYIGADYHHDAHSHIDALCHVVLDGAIYNGKPSASLTEKGATVNTIDVVKNGLVGRGVLLDIPRLRGVRWLEPSEHVFREDLEAAEREQGVTVAKGDILLVRTGHARRLREVGPWDTEHAKAGLHPTTSLFLAERCIAALGSDGNNDTAPSSTKGIGFPIHALTLNAMGLHLIDYLQFEDLVPACERAGRWEFLFVGAPLHIVGGTGSPLNPIAIF